MTAIRGNPKCLKIIMLTAFSSILLLSILSKLSFANMNLIAETSVALQGELTHDTERDLIYLPNGYGLLIIDISNPWRPEIIGQCPTDDYTSEISFSGNLIFTVPSYGEKKQPHITVINAEDPTAPEIVDFWYSPGVDRVWAVSSTEDFVYTVHGTEMPGGDEMVHLSTLLLMEDGQLDHVSTIEVPASSRMISVENYLYLSAAFSLNLVSLENPEEPEFIDVIGGMWHKLVYHDEHVYSGGPFNAVTINNVEDPTDPFIVNAIDADTSVYDISVNRDLMAVSRKTGIRLYGMWDFPDEEIILDANDFDDPTPWVSDNVLLTDNALITSFDEYGMRFFDIIDPFEPEQFDEIRQPPGALSIQVHRLGDNFITLSKTTDLVYCMHLEGDQIEVLGEILIPDILTLEIRGNLGVASCGSSGISIIDFENPENPELIGRWEPWLNEQQCHIWASVVTLDGNTMYMSCTPDADDHVQVYLDISDPANPELGEVFFDERALYDFVVTEDHLIGFSNNHIYTFNIEDQHNPEQLCHHHESCGTDPIIQGDYIYLTSSSTRTILRVIDVSDMTDPVMVYNPDVNSEYKANSMVARGDVLMLFCASSGIIEYDISNPAEPDSVRWYDTPGSANFGCWFEDNLIISDYTSIRLYEYEEPPPPEPFTLHLQPGWSIISSPVTPVDPRIIQLFEPLVDNDDNLQIAKDYLGHFYIPHMYNDIPPWDPTRGYWIKLNEPDSLIFEGEEVPERMPIMLHERWSTAAYLPRQSCEAPDAFINVIDQLMLVKDDDGNFYFPELDFCNIPPLQRGRGYQVKVSEATELVWTFDDMAASIQVSHPSSPSHFTEPEHTGLNMSLLIKQKDETSESLNDCEMGVFTMGGLCVGACVLEGEGAWGIAVWGDDPTTAQVDGAVDNEQLAFRIWNGTIEDNVELAWIEGEAKYAADDLVIASLDWEAAVPQQVGLTSAYPNPFNSRARLEYSLKNNTTVSLKVINTSGRLVLTLVNEEQQAGSHSVIWDASNQPTGVYLVTLNACGVTETVKMIHLK